MSPFELKHGPLILDPQFPLMKRHNKRFYIPPEHSIFDSPHLEEFSAGEGLKTARGYLLLSPKPYVYLMPFTFNRPLIRFTYLHFHLLLSLFRPCLSIHLHQIWIHEPYRPYPLTDHSIFHKLLPKHFWWESMLCFLLLKLYGLKPYYKFCLRLKLVEWTIPRPERLWILLSSSPRFYPNKSLFHLLLYRGIEHGVLTPVFHLHSKRFQWLSFPSPEEKHSLFVRLGCNPLSFRRLLRHHCLSIYPKSREGKWGLVELLRCVGLLEGFGVKCH